MPRAPCRHPPEVAISDLVFRAGFVLADPVATAALGRHLAALLRPGDVVALAGGLGAGKTALAREVIVALAGGPLDVPSPTFTLVQVYDVAPAPVWHFDLYRLAGPDEVLELGWDEALAGGIALVEWPDRLGPLLPADRLDLALDFGATPDSRSVQAAGHDGWAARLPRLVA